MARTEIDYLRERDDKAQARIVELESQLAELREAAQVVCSAASVMGVIDTEGDAGRDMDDAIHALRAALAASDGEKGRE